MGSALAMRDGPAQAVISVLPRMHAALAKIAKSTPLLLRLPTCKSRNENDLIVVVKSN